MTSDKHHKAIAIIKQRLEKEFEGNIEGVGSNSQSIGRLPYRPDLIVVMKTGKFLVVEVGFLNPPEKVIAYLKEDDIIEFRWYTKDPKLIWAVNKADPAHGVKLLNQNEIDRVIEKHPLYDSWVTCCCPTCGELFRAQKGNLFAYGSGRVKYLVCPNCDHFDGTPRSQR